MNRDPSSGQGNLCAPNLTFADHEPIAKGRRFVLTAEEVEQTLVKGVRIRAWGYNGSTPGPVLVVREGELVEVVLRNRLPEPTSLHWHGLIVPNDMDGVPAIRAGGYSKPGSEYVYRFQVRQTGTYTYHAHVNNAKQEMMGLAGVLIALPQQQGMGSDNIVEADRDFTLMLQEWSVRSVDVVSGLTADQQAWAAKESISRLYSVDPLSRDFDFFTINGKCAPDTEPLKVRHGDTVRIRLANISMHSHPMHLHGHYFRVIAVDGVPQSIPQYRHTLNVCPGETYDIEFTANNPGTWAFHCHKPHHLTNGSRKNPGGMFTTVVYEV